MLDEKPLVWVGSALADLKDLPDEPRRDIGFALSAVQAGKFPTDTKPFKVSAVSMKSARSGVCSEFR